MFTPADQRLCKPRSLHPHGKRQKALVEKTTILFHILTVRPMMSYHFFGELSTHACSSPPRNACSLCRAGRLRQLVPCVPSRSSAGAEGTRAVTAGPRPSRPDAGAGREPFSQPAGHRAAMRLGSHLQAPVPSRAAALRSTSIPQVPAVLRAFQGLSGDGIGHGCLLRVLA